MQAKRRSLAIEVVSGLVLGLLAEMGLDGVFFRLIRQPWRWSAARQYLISHLFIALLLGAAFSAALIFRRRWMGWLASIPPTMRQAVGREHLRVGALTGGGALVLGIWMTFLALIDNPRPAAACAGMIVGTVAAGMAGAAAAVTIVYAARGGKGKPGGRWAVAGGLIGGWLGFMAVFWLAYALG